MNVRACSSANRMPFAESFRLMDSVWRSAAGKPPGIAVKQAPQPLFELVHPALMNSAHTSARVLPRNDMPFFSEPERNAAHHTRRSFSKESGGRPDVLCVQPFSF